MIRQCGMQQAMVRSLGLLTNERLHTDTRLDYIRTIVSLAACLLKVVTQPERLQKVFWRMLPYIALTSSFACFVLVNGGVVLGDRSNHVATLHLPQMLYIWPYITFFSWPLLYPYLLLPALSIFAKLPHLNTLEGLLIFKRRSMLPKLSLVLAMIVMACLVVRLNTIVHPFTLADNRHYPFYVFRLLLRPWWMRHAVTPIYLLCGWASIQALGGGPVKAPSNQKPITTRRIEMANHSAVKAIGSSARRLPLPDSTHSATTSFVLVWVVTSALQLITAPLVEPRYFILPWIFWRLHLPVQTSQDEDSQIRDRRLASLWERVDPKLALETAWLLAINAATGYIFLEWGFAWPQEPGKVQRFMW